MTNFYLKKIKRRMFVIVDDKLFLAPRAMNCTHGDWFIQEGWMDKEDSSFIEQNPRGYVDKEGIYIYQGYEASVPKISKRILEKNIKKLLKKLDLNDNLHVFFGTIKEPDKKIWYGKLPPQKDLGSIAEILKIEND